MSKPFIYNGLKAILLQQLSNLGVAIPTQIMIIDDLMNKYVATPREKIALINQYKSIILEYGLENNLDIYGDYINMLSTQDNLTLSHK